MYSKIRICYMYMYMRWYIRLYILFGVFRASQFWQRFAITQSCSRSLVLRVTTDIKGEAPKIGFVFWEPQLLTNSDHELTSAAELKENVWTLDNRNMNSISKWRATRAATAKVALTRHVDTSTTRQRSSACDGCLRRFWRRSLIAP